MASARRKNPFDSDEEDDFEEIKNPELAAIRQQQDFHQQVKIWLVYYEQISTWFFI